MLLGESDKKNFDENEQDSVDADSIHSFKHETPVIQVPSESEITKRPPK